MQVLYFYFYMKKKIQGKQTLKEVFIKDKRINHLHINNNFLIQLSGTMKKKMQRIQTVGVIHTETNGNIMTVGLKKMSSRD